MRAARRRQRGRHRGLAKPADAPAGANHGVGGPPGLVHRLADSPGARARAGAVREPGGADGAAVAAGVGGLERLPAPRLLRRPGQRPPCPSLLHCSLQKHPSDKAAAAVAATAAAAQYLGEFTSGERHGAFYV